MGIANFIRKVLSRVFKKEASKRFNISPKLTNEMEGAISQWLNIYRGNPDWIDEEDNIKTIKFAKTICSETARLTTLATSINVDGSARAKWISEQLSKLDLRKYTELACACGGIILKPNGKGIDCVLPTDFLVIDDNDGEITGAVFFDYLTKGDRYYTRMEMHRFDGDKLRISNAAYMSKSEGEFGKEVPLDSVLEWSELEEDIYIDNVDSPLYGYFKMPEANDIDMRSPLGIAVFSQAIEELKDLDIAYSRNSLEIKDSQKIVLADDRLMASAGSKLGTSDIKLPHYVKNVCGSGMEEFYQEINPQLNTEARKKGIDQQLSLIGYKCGYSNGYFVFEERTGMVTATQVESDDQRTIQFIKDVRDALQKAINGLIYALNVYADLYDLAPVGTYEVTYDFGDITYSWEEDRARHWQYVQQGKYPLWRYYVKFEGMTEEEAKEVVAEANGEDKKKGLFEE